MEVETKETPAPEVEEEYDDAAQRFRMWDEVNLDDEKIYALKRRWHAQDQAMIEKQRKQLLAIVQTADETRLDRLLRAAQVGKAMPNLDDLRERFNFAFRKRAEGALRFFHDFQNEIFAGLQSGKLVIHISLPSPHGYFDNNKDARFSFEAEVIKVSAMFKAVTINNNDVALSIAFSFVPPHL